MTSDCSMLLNVITPEGDCQRSTAKIIGTVFMFITLGIIGGFIAYYLITPMIATAGLHSLAWSDVPPEWQITAYVFAGLIVVSLIVAIIGGMVNGYGSFWDYFILRDLFVILGHILMAIIEVAGKR